MENDTLNATDIESVVKNKNTLFLVISKLKNFDELINNLNKENEYLIRVAINNNLLSIEEYIKIIENDEAFDRLQTEISKNENLFILLITKYPDKLEKILYENSICNLINIADGILDNLNKYVVPTNYEIRRRFQKIVSLKEKAQKKDYDSISLEELNALLDAEYTNKWRAIVENKNELSCVFDEVYLEQINPSN